jgi:hypothetical protein
MGRTAAARTIGVSKTTFRRNIEGKLLTPEVGPDGVHWFREEQVRELVIQQRATKAAAPDAYNGEMAAAVFALLDEAIHPVDIVKRLHLDPRAVEALHRQWASMRDTFVVTGDIARQIEEVPWLGGSRPLRDGQQLLACLSYADPHDCEKCQEEVATLCAKCAKAMNAREAEQRAEEARAHSNERERQRRKGMWEREFLPRHLERAGRNAQERSAGNRKPAPASVGERAPMHSNETKPATETDEPTPSRNRDR